MPLQAKINDHVVSERLGAGEFRVVAMDDRHYTVEAIGGGTRQPIYKALCQIPVKLALANQARRVERASGIGRGKR